MNALVCAVTKEVDGAQVHRVKLRVGKSAAVSVDALHFCFDVCVRDTVLSGATLNLVETDSDELVLEEVEVS